MSTTAFEALSRRTGLFLVALAIVVAPVGMTHVQVAGAAPPLTFDNQRIDPGGFEPRVAVGPDNKRWDSTQSATISGAVTGGAEVVFGSPDGHTWTKTAANPNTTAGPCCDNDMIVTPTGRLISSIIDNVTFQIKVHYSDDQGKTWSESLVGTNYIDQDRQWFAVGPKDPVTGQNDVYMLWHNLFTGTANHEMMVSTSRDNGATFLPPIPITPPGTQAYLDLQCADSGGPSNIVANPRTGDVYAIFGTRSSALGGCGASVLGPFEINIVAATRIWVSRSTDQGVTWTPSLALDDSGDGTSAHPSHIVGMQVNAGALDNAGNVYVTYPESPREYRDYTGASIKYVWSPGDLSHWSEGKLVAPAGGPGHILAHMVAGDPGKLAFFYVTGAAPPPSTVPLPPLWYPTAAVTLNGLDPVPTVTESRVDDVPMWKGTATTLMGACDTTAGITPQTPPFDVLNTAVSGFTCTRSSDVLGMAVDSTCHFMATWYAAKGDNTGGIGGAPAGSEGTYVSTQTGGPTLGNSCSVGGLPPVTSAGSSPSPVSSANPVSGGGGTPGTSTGMPVGGLAALALLLLAAALGGARALAARR